MSIYNFFANLGPWNWLILAVVLFGLETVVPGVHFLWFALSASVVGMIALASGIALPWQIVIFAVLAMVSVFLARLMARPDAAISDLPDLNSRAAQYVGRVVTVEEPIREGRGKVRIGDTLWQAEGNDAAIGTRVRIKSANGPVFLVEPVTG
jgi:inner membrane protein